MPFQMISLVTRSRCELRDITGEIRSVLSASGVEEGLVCVCSPHTTAGITINENADPSVKRDILAWMGKTIPERGDYTHGEGNSDAHIKTLMTGLSVQIPVHKGELVLGTWQGIYFCEYDGPRNRNFTVQILADQSGDLIQ